MSGTSEPATLLRDAEEALEADRGLALVRRHVARNLKRRVRLGEAAAIAGLEETYFCYYFRTKVGVTFLQWQTALRIAHAIERLLESDDPITKVSRQVGYRDIRTFERNFKRLTGLTPTQFREEG